MMGVIFCNLYFIEVLTYEHVSGKADRRGNQFPWQLFTVRFQAVQQRALSGVVQPDE